MAKKFISLLLFVAISFELSEGYSALEDARIIKEFKREQRLRTTNHAQVARTLVHQANWASVGSISINPKVVGFPMVSIIAVDDNAQDVSTGKIHFMLVDLDFLGQDWQHDNKVTFLFTDAQTENCSHRGDDPMEPTCARTMISGKVVQMKTGTSEYDVAVNAFVKRHPASKKWIDAHNFYLCELQIDNIFVLDYYGGPKNIPVELYYSTNPKSN